MGTRSIVDLEFIHGSIRTLNPGSNRLIWQSRSDKASLKSLNLWVNSPSPPPIWLDCDEMINNGSSHTNKTQWSNHCICSYITVISYSFTILQFISHCQVSWSSETAFVFRFWHLFSGLCIGFLEGLIIFKVDILEGKVKLNEIRLIRVTLTRAKYYTLSYIPSQLSIYKGRNRFVPKFLDYKKL